MISGRAEHLEAINKRSELILEEIKSADHLKRDYLEEKLKKYICIKLMLPEEDISDNITLMAQMSVARALNIDITKVPGVDNPGQCGGSTAVLSKRIQLFLAVQRGLGVTIDPKGTPSITMVADLADIILPQLCQVRTEI